ncbi:MAG: hypothetical protein R3C44_12290 [Chloroflexota bacterium]
MTLDIVTRSLFSYDISDEAAHIGEAMDTMVSIGKPRHRKVQEALAYLDHVVVQLIEERMASDETPPDDLLTTLLAVEYEDGSRMPLQQVRDEVMSLMVAGMRRQPIHYHGTGICWPSIRKSWPECNRNWMMH